MRGGDGEAVVFTGSGATSAVALLRSALHFPKAPLVVAGPFAHHTNLLPWREMAQEVLFHILSI